MRQQVRPSDAAFHRQARHRRLHDGLAASAGHIDELLMAATKQLAPSEQLIGIGVELAGDAQNCGVRPQQLGRDGQLELLDMTLIN